jgi:hypothetical protein
MTAAIEVRDAVLRQVARSLADTGAALSGDLTASYHAATPDRSVNAGWAASAALDAAVAGADALLSAAAAATTGLGEALARAANAYERADRGLAR